MRRATEIVLNEMKRKMSGYAVMMQYNFMNLCVKAEPASLLSLTIRNSEDDALNIEDAAGVMRKNDYQFEVVPKSEDLLYPISRAIVVSHPEFKMETITADEDKRVYTQDKEEQHIIVTMPEVNKERHDLLMDSVKALYDECSARIDKVRVDYLIRLQEKLASYPPADYDEAKDEVDKSYDQHKDIIKTYRDNKEKEIEDAYQRWLTNHEDEAFQEEEDQEENRGDVLTTFNFNSEY